MAATKTAAQCAEQECEAPKTHRVAWPGRGWVDYCEPHAMKAQGVLEHLGSAAVLEPIPDGLLDVDWPGAEQRLREIRHVYEEIGAAGRLALHVTIRPLGARLERGERTRALYDEIMGLKF